LLHSHMLRLDHDIVARVYLGPSRQVDRIFLDNLLDQGLRI